MSNIIEIGGGASGGSNVIANPIEAATDVLSKIGIDGTVYGISGGGGSGYSETVLWSGSETPTTSGTQITLTDNISNYDEIAFVVGITSYSGANAFLVSELTIGNTYIATIYSPEEFGAFWHYDSANKVTIRRQASAKPQTYTKVIGIKYGSGASGHNYSTTEHIVGTWIDGSILYEKTISFGALPNNTTKAVPHGITNLGIVVSCIGISSDGSNSLVLCYVNGSSDRVGVYFDSTNANIITSTNISAYTETYLTIQYTKTS